MLINFLQNYKSISDIKPTELPDFVILTGINGSGKTQLLEAIINKSVNLTVGELPMESQKIIYINSQQLFDLYNPPIINNLQTDKTTEEEHSYSDVIISSIIIKMCNTIRDFKKDPSETIYTRSEYLCKAIFNYLKNIQCDSDELKRDVLNSVKLEYTILDEYQNQILHDTFINAIKDISSQKKSLLANHLKPYMNRPYNFDGKRDIGVYNPLPQKMPENALKKEFLDATIQYFRAFSKNSLQKLRLENKKNNASLTPKNFTEIYGIPPWDFLNNILGKYGVNGYFLVEEEIINYLEKSLLGESEKGFVLRLKNKNTKVTISENDLSSGEKILFALSLMIYKRLQRGFLPAVLLLDEIDNGLHPSMLKQLLDIFYNLFFKELGINIILTTHSPTTVALAPEEYVVVMNRKESNLSRLVKCSKEEALNTLTEGFASLTAEEHDLGLSYNIANTALPVLFTEGITDKIILEAAWKKLNKDKEVPFYIQDCFGVSFLKNLLNSSSCNSNGIFNLYQDKIFITLFDFDSGGYNGWNGLKDFLEEPNSDPYKCLTKKYRDKKAYALLLPVPDSDIKKQVMIGDSDTETYKDKSVLYLELLFYGIDNLEKYFYKRTVAGEGSVIEFKGNKREFAKKTRNFDKDQFKHFKPIFEKIESILNCISEV